MRNAYPSALKFRSGIIGKLYMRQLLILISVLFLMACEEKREKPDYFEFQNGIDLAELKNSKIEEASGLASSEVNRGMLWTHNDSGNPAEVYLVDENLKINLTCKLEGIRNRDWEDIAVGPGPDSTKSYVYVGDIGDNFGRYNYKMIYRFEEPAFDPNVSSLNITDFDTIVFELPDERKDSETLLVNPVTHEIFIVTKRDDPVTVYKIGSTDIESDTVQASKIGNIDLTFIVGGSFSHDGKELILKNIDNVYYWQIAAGETMKEIIQRKPKVLPYKREPQGEAVTFKADGSGFYTISELQSGEKSFLRFYQRKEVTKPMQVSK